MTRAMSFNGVSDYVDCGNDESLDLGTIHTTTAWLKLGTQHQIVFGRKTGQSDYSMFFYNDDLYYKVNDAYVSVPYSLPMSTFHHFVITRNGATVKFYYDGNQLGTTQTLVSEGGTSSRLDLIGAGTSVGNAPCNGSIADVRIYNRALNTTEIKQLYNQYNSVVII